MSEKNVKGPLVKHNKKKDFLRAQPVKFNDKDPFKYSSSAKEEKTSEVTSETTKTPEAPEPKKVEKKEIEIKKPVEKVATPRLPEVKKKKKAVVGKYNSVKTLKVPAELHTQLNVLGKFMDKSKTYEILNELVENYVDSQLTERQQKQFRFMSDFMNDENDV